MKKYKNRWFMPRTDVKTVDQLREIVSYNAVMSAANHLNLKKRIRRKHTTSL